MSTCSVDSGYSRISDEEMKGIMKAAINSVYSLLWKERQRREHMQVLVWERDTPALGDPERYIHHSSFSQEVYPC